MRYISYVITAIIIGVVYSIAKKENKKAIQNSSDDFMKMRLPKIYIGVGVICSLFFAALFVLMTLFPNDTAEIWVGIVFIGFMLLGLLIIFASIKWKVEIYKDYMIYFSILGRKYEFKYSEIKEVRLTQNSLKIKTDRKKFSIDAHAIGIDVILKRFNENNIIVK